MELCSTEVLFKERIHQLRENRNLSKAAVAKAVGLDYSYYHRLENQSLTTTPKFPTLESIADFYGISVAELFVLPSGETGSLEKAVEI